MNKSAHLAGLGFTLIFGFSYMFSKIALSYVSPMGLIAYRYLIAFTIIEVLRRFEIIEINLKGLNFKMILLVVLFQPFLYSIFSIYGINLIASSEAIMMIALIPIFSGIISAIFLKEVPSFRQVLFILLSLGGIIYIQLSLQNVETSSQPLGFILVLTSVICGAVYNVTSRKASQTMRSIDITYYMMIFGVISFNTIYLGMLLSEGNVFGYVTNFVQLRLLIPILYLGVLSTVGAFFMLNYALSKLPAHVVGIYANLVTVIGVFAGYLILSETLYYFHFIGSAMIVLGVYGTVASKKRVVMRKEI